MFDLTGKVAVVTGGSSGLGVGFAKALARQGADIVLMARRVSLMEEVAAEIRSLGCKCLPVACDVRDTEQIDAAIAQIKEQFSRVDILVNNAGLAEVAPTEEHTDEQWNRVIDINLTGTFKCARAFAREFMIPQKYGRMINIGSLYSFVGNNSGTLGSTGVNYSQLIGYSASKGGIVTMTKFLGAEWAKQNITVNAIAPGYIASGLSDTMVPEFHTVIVKNYCPMGRLGDIRELEGALIYFASDASSYTTGTVLPVDGGWTAI